MDPTERWFESEFQVAESEKNRHHQWIQQKNRDYQWIQQKNRYNQWKNRHHQWIQQKNHYNQWIQHHQWIQQKNRIKFNFPTHKSILIAPLMDYPTHTDTDTDTDTSSEKLLESKLQVAESEMSHTAIEYLTSVAAEFCLHGVISNRKYPPQFHSRLFAVLMRMLLDVKDDDYEEEEEEGDSFRLAKKCLFRLANNLGGNIIWEGVASDQIPAYLATPDEEWRKHHAALVALEQISRGCLKFMIRNSQQLVTMDMVLNSFRHPHPRVRWAALTALARVSYDLNLLPRYYTRMLPALASAMDDFEYPNLQEHAASAVINFIKNFPPDILTPFEDEIVSKLSLLLQSSNTWVQEAAVTALASVADNSYQEQFQKYYDEVMPYLKAILVSKNEKTSRMLRVSAKRCIDHFAVGKDKFRDDPKQVPGEKVIKAVKGYNLGKRKCQLLSPDQGLKRLPRPNANR